MRRIADTIGKVLDLPVISLPAAASAQHFGWLDRVARMDAPACSALTRQTLGWRPLRPERLLDDLGALRPAERI